MFLGLLLFVSTAHATAPSGIKKLSATHYEVQESALAGVQKDLNSVLQSARMVPYMEKEKFAGFLFTDIAKDSLFRALGFREKDILTQVNEVVLDNPGKGLLAFQALREAKTIQAHVRRGKKKLLLRYDRKS